MSDDSPSIVVAIPGERGAETLSAEAVESIVNDFRAWLQEAKEVPAPAPAPFFDPATIVQQFTALRQEVNLQTKSSRSLLEQNSQMTDLLRQAYEGMKAQQSRLQEMDQQEQNELLRPLLKTLIDAHDALSLARREVQRQLANVPVPAAVVEPAAAPAVEIRLPIWARWLGLASTVAKQVAPLREAASNSPAEGNDSAARRTRGILDALLVGYEMSLQRIERTLQNQRLEVISCMGLPFDPEFMEVVEVIRDPAQTGTQVVEVVRNGYLWRDRLLRFAQVRVAKA